MSLILWLTRRVRSFRVRTPVAPLLSIVRRETRLSASLLAVGIAAALAGWGEVPKALGFIPDGAATWWGWVTALCLGGTVAWLSGALSGHGAAEGIDTASAAVGALLVALSPYLVMFGTMWPVAAFWLLFGLAALAMAVGRRRVGVGAVPGCVGTFLLAFASCAAARWAEGSVADHGPEFLHSVRRAWDIPADPDPLYAGVVTAREVAYRVADTGMWAMWASTALALPLLIRGLRPGSSANTAELSAGALVLAAGLGFVAGTVFVSGPIGLAGVLCVAASMTAYLLGQLRQPATTPDPR